MFCFICFFFNVRGRTLYSSLTFLFHFFCFCIFFLYNISVHFFLTYVCELMLEKKKVLEDGAFSTIGYEGIVLQFFFFFLMFFCFAFLLSFLFPLFFVYSSIFWCRWWGSREIVTLGWVKNYYISQLLLSPMNCFIFVLLSLSKSFHKK